MEVNVFYSSRNLSDTEYMLEIDPGLEKFTHFIFDLDVEHYIRHREGKLVEYGTRTKYAGLDYILDAYDNLPGFREKVEAGRVAIFIGHSIDILSETDATERAVYRNCRCISKLVRNPSDEILKWLKGE